MNIKTAQKLIERELRDLGVPAHSAAYKLVMEQALAAAEVLPMDALSKFIQEYVESLPVTLFGEV